MFYNVLSILPLRQEGLIRRLIIGIKAPKHAGHKKVAHSFHGFGRPELLQIYQTSFVFFIAKQDLKNRSRLYQVPLTGLRERSAWANVPSSR